MIKNVDAVRIVDEHRGDAIIITTMNSGHAQFGLPSVTQREELNFPLSGAMGKASSFGLGLALAQPEHKVIVLDGDGSLLMNLGTLVTISNKAPENIYHFVFDNGVYAWTGGQPVPGGDIVKYEEMARAAGYAAVYLLDDIEELASNVDSILRQKGPVLVNLKVAPEIDPTPDKYRPSPPRSMKIAIKDMSERFGR